MTDSVPEKLGKYRIIEEVGRGSFAAVYKAVDTTLERTVALKVLAPHLLWDPAFVQRFQREAKVVANLYHPNIVTIYEVSQVEGVYFIAMQFLEGRTLSRVLEAVGPLPISAVQVILEQIATALDYAHARGFVHRDIKPSNIIVADDGRVTLTDFGLVKAGEGTQLTASGVVFGTPEYMSPEQAEGKALDARSDIYSLGVVLYEMLAGRAPFVADTTPAVMYKRVHEPPPLEELPSDLSQGVAAVVEKALAKKREERYQSAEEMAGALAAAVEAKAEPKVGRKEKLVARGSLPIWGWGSIALVAALVIGVAIFLAIQGCEPTAMPMPAAQPATRTATVTATAIPMPPTDTPTSTSTPTKTPTLVPPTATPVVPTPTPTPLPPTNTPTNAPTNTPVPVSPTDTPTPSATPDMVYVPAGEFIMGSHQRSNEQPVHAVYLDAFYIDKTEATNAQYRACVEAGLCRAPTICDWGEPTYEDPSKIDHPVVCVSWNDAKAYCEWAGKRLPTEAEWEKAARGTDGRTYPWGEGIDCDRAQYSGCGGQTVPVGSKPKGGSPYGALDMAGNVWEWVADWYDSGYYSRSPERNPLGPDSGELRVLRGGSWVYIPTSVRCAIRDWYIPDKRSSGVGFRCVRGSQ